MNVWMGGEEGGQRSPCVLGTKGSESVIKNLTVFHDAQELTLLQSLPELLMEQTAVGKGGWGERPLYICDRGVTVPFLAGPDSPGFGGHRRGQGEGSPCSSEDRCSLQSGHRLPWGAGR